MIIIRKLSFALAISKGGGGMHKPKKGPSFVMSGSFWETEDFFKTIFWTDFFVYTIPEEWERSGIRTTPKSYWVIILEEITMEDVCSSLVNLGEPQTTATPIPSSQPACWKTSGSQGMSVQWFKISCKWSFSLYLFRNNVQRNFIECWDHFHGVLTENYFCPKLYLTK